MNLAIVIDESQLAKSVHEKTHARPRGADHLRQRFLADFRQDRFWHAFFAEIRQKEKGSSKPLLAGVEQLIDKVGLDTTVAGQQMGDKQFGEGRLRVNYADNFGLRHSCDRTFSERGDRRQTQDLSGQTSFPEEIAGSKNRDYGFLTLLRENGDLGFSRLHIENGIGGSALPINDLMFPVFRKGSPAVHFRKERFGFERCLHLGTLRDRLAHPSASSKGAEVTLPHRFGGDYPAFAATIARVRASVPFEEVELLDEADRYFRELEGEFGVEPGADIRAAS